VIDHIIMFVEADGLEIGRMASLGLVETYRRNHHGQGTQNVCYCFDNLFLELLWVNDGDAARSQVIKRARIYERSLWRTNGACPFGIAWRRSFDGPAFTIPTWEFTPPYLPMGLSIPVATESDDPRQPLMFESPGGTPPVEWPMERRGSLQQDAGLGAVTEIRLTMPVDVPPSEALRVIARAGEPRVRVDAGREYRVQLRVASLVDKPDLEINLPLPA